MPSTANPPRTLAGQLPSLDALAGLISQHARLLAIETPLPSAALLVERFAGREAISELFHFEVDCLAASAHLELKALIGEEVSLRLLQADGRRRSWHGYVTSAALLGSDGGLARYRLHLEPWLSFAAIRHDCRIFQDRTALEVVEAVLGTYRQANFESRLTAAAASALPKRAVCTQYRETDLAFVRRLLASEGLSYYFEHADEASASASEAPSEHARHKLVVCDATYARPACPQATVRFHRLSATEAEDAIHTVTACRAVQSNAVAAASWDHRALIAHGAREESAADNGDLPVLEDYSGSGQYRYTGAADVERLTRLRLQARELANKSFAATGSVRQLAAGQTFNLTDHPDFTASGGESNNRLLVLAIDHEAANNLRPDVRELLDHAGVEYGTYRQRASLVRASIPVVPTYRRAPSVSGLHSALVVGLDNAPLTSERDGRIKIQLPWQRGAQPNSGGLAADDGNAPGNEASGTWVRVAQSQAGPNWGALFTPRIGTEVLVEFVEGDVDRPLVIGALHNGQDAPPFAAGVDSGINHGGVISGLHTPTLDGAGFNQWLADDAPGQLRQRLLSSYAAAQLSLGHLIRHKPASAARGTWRGEGFELAADAWSALRAGEGLFLSATARPGAASTQLDTAEARARLGAAHELGKTLSEAALRQNARRLEAHAPGQVLETLIGDIDPTACGSCDAAVGGQPAGKPQAGSRAPGDPVERFAQPRLVADTPAAALFASPASTALFAGQTLAVAVHGDVQQAATHNFAAVAGKAASFFTHGGGLQAIAASGPLSLKAHADKLEILADTAVTVTSVNAAIEIQASTQITLTAGGAQVCLDGGDISFACPGTFSVKGVSHAFTGPGSSAASLPALPSGTTDIQNWIGLDYRDPESGDFIAGAGYEIHFKGGPLLSGTLDGNGLARHDNIAAKTVAKVVYKPRPANEDKPYSPLSELLG